MVKKIEHLKLSLKDKFLLNERSPKFRLRIQIIATNGK